MGERRRVGLPAAAPAVAGDPRPVGRAGERGHDPTDPGGPRHPRLPAVPGRVPDPRGLRGGAARRRPAGMAGPRLQPAGRASCTGRRGPSWPTTAAGFPTTWQALEALPGIGPYTARAVLAFAFGRDVGVVDTNCRAGLARAVAGRPLGRREAQQLVDAMVPPGRGWQFGQALLDLGATVCVAGAPRCAGCPVRRRCRWASRGQDDSRPGHGVGRGGGRPVDLRGIRPPGPGPPGRRPAAAFPSVPERWPR